MQITGINSFHQDVIMLVGHTNTHYHKRVPLQVGSRIIDQIVKSLTDEELKLLSQSWELAYISTILSKSLQVIDKEFDLHQVKGNVVITKKVIIPALQMIIVKGLTRDTGHLKGIHVLMEQPLNVKTCLSQGKHRI